jgi:lambda family phage portal protein
VREVRQQPQTEQTLLDRAIGYFFPREAARRLAARGQVALLSGYLGARRDRVATAGWSTASNGSPQNDVIVDIVDLRQRCADLERNAPVAAAIVNTNAEYVVGTGLAAVPTLEAAVLGLSEAQASAWQDNTRRRFEAWADSKDCDFARFQNFYGLQDLALRGVLVRGDIFALTPMADRGAGPRLTLQMVEADLVSNPGGRSDTDTLTQGIEHDSTTGEAVLYHVANRHPYDLSRGQPRRWTEVAARGERTGRRNVLHLFMQRRPGLRRGVPILAPVIEPIKQVLRYTEAELQAAIVSGLFAVFFKMDPEAFQDIFEKPQQEALIRKATQWSGEMDSGQAVNLLPGEEAQTVNPGRPNEQFDPFLDACFKQIGMAVGMPREVLLMAYNSSYSAARGALLMAWRFFTGRRAWLAREFCQPVYELWLADEVAAGRIAAPGFFSDPVVRWAWSRCLWVGDGPGSIDPQKEVAAARERVALGISTLEAESLLHDGVAWSAKHPQTVREATQRREARLTVPGEQQAAAKAAATDQE